MWNLLEMMGGGGYTSAMVTGMSNDLTTRVFPPSFWGADLLFIFSLFLQQIYILMSVVTFISVLQSNHYSPVEKNKWPRLSLTASSQPMLVMVPTSLMASSPSSPGVPKGCRHLRLAHNIPT